MLMHSSATQQLNSYYLEEDSMDHYLTELNMFLFLRFIFYMAFCLFLFIYSVMLSLICNYLPGVCNFLNLVSLAISFVVINFLFS